jgi:hypothetical protein
MTVQPMYQQQSTPAPETNRESVASTIEMNDVPYDVQVHGNMHQQANQSHHHAMYPSNVRMTSHPPQAATAIKSVVTRLIESEMLNLHSDLERKNSERQIKEMEEREFKRKAKQKSQQMSEVFWSVAPAVVPPSYYPIQTPIHQSMQAPIPALIPPNQPQIPPPFQQPIQQPSYPSPSPYYPYDPNQLSHHSTPRR